MQTKRITADDMDARAEALEEAGTHLGLEWTNDPCERTAGGWVASRLFAEADRWRDRAAAKRAPAPGQEGEE